MSRERRAQSVPPAPTVPPPDEPTLATRTKSRLEPWHYLLGLAVILMGAGAAFADWSRSKATVEQLDDAKASVTAQVGAVQATTALQLGVLQAEVYKAKEAQARVEGKLDVLLDMVSDVRDQLRKKKNP